MNILLFNKIGKVLTLLLIVIGFYHLLLFANNINLIVINKDILYSMYHIAHNGIILSLLFIVKHEIKKVKNISKKYNASVGIFSIYFIYKILLNVAYMFDFFTNFVDKYIPDVNIWSFVCVLVIIVSLLLIKFNRW